MGVARKDEYEDEKKELSRLYLEKKNKFEGNKGFQIYDS